MREEVGDHFLVKGKFIALIDVNCVICSTMAEATAAVREALRTICKDGREDILSPGVLSQVWIGLERKKRTAASGVSPAVAACVQVKALWLEATEPRAN